MGAGGGEEVLLGQSKAEERKNKDGDKKGQWWESATDSCFDILPVGRIEQ